MAEVLCVVVFLLFTHVYALTRVYGVFLISAVVASSKLRLFMIRSI